MNIMANASSLESIVVFFFEHRILRTGAAPRVLDYTLVQIISIFLFTLDLLG